MGWTVQGSNTGGDEIFHIHPDWPWGPPTQSPVQWVPGLSVMWPGHGINHPCPSSVEVEERVHLHIYSPSRSSWPVLG